MVCIMYNNCLSHHVTCTRMYVHDLVFSLNNSELMAKNTTGRFMLLLINSLSVSVQCNSTMSLHNIIHSITQCSLYVCVTCADTYPQIMLRIVQQ